MSKRQPGTGQTNGHADKSMYTSKAGNCFESDCHSFSHGLPQRAVAADVNLRAGHNRYDYEEHRQADRIPTKHSDIIIACQAIYRKVGMVRNIIDLMTDFASEGLQLQHPVKSQERFFKEWARRVDLQGRAHDFMKLLIRDANVIVSRKNAFIPRPVVNEMSKADNAYLGLVDETVVPEKPERIKTTKKQTSKRVIPWRYTFLSPALVEKIGGEVGKFFGSDALALRIPSRLAKSITSPRTDAEKEWISKLQSKIVKSVKNRGSTLIALDQDRIYVDYYKKDDWEDWGTPFLYGVLEDVMFKEKMRLADMAALDGVINVVRLWKLGNTKEKIYPTPAMTDKLIDILQHNTGGGVMDLVWDDMIDLKVEYPPTDKILGADKYKGVNADIIRGLGIPDSLVGGQDSGSRSAQSAYVEIKNLAEKLEYIRSRAIKWVEGELRLVADAMGFKKIPSIGFGIMSLRDEAAEKQLIIQLLDRGVISAEKVSEVFGVNYMIEVERIKSEQDIREGNPGVMERAGPYYRPISVMEKQNDLAIELQKVKNGYARDSKFPDLVDDEGGDNPLGDQPDDDGDNPSGRPPSTVDTNPRDDRTSRTFATMSAIAHDIMHKIDNVFDDTYLRQNNVKNIRSLTKSQKDELDGVKRLVLSLMKPYDKITEELMRNRLKGTTDMTTKMDAIYTECMNDFTESTKRIPTHREKRMICALSWVAMVIGK